MGRILDVLTRLRTLTMTLAAMLALGFGPGARASLILDISADAGASIEFQGTGTQTTFAFHNISSGNGFVVTDSNGFGDSVGLHGVIGGTYSYTKASIVTSGLVQTAPVITSNGSITITDASLKTLTGTIAGLDVTTIGTGGVVNLNGSINLTNIKYTGSNQDLMQLRNEAAIDGGVVALSFQFLPGKTLTQLDAKNADYRTSYSGSILTAVPEPSSLILAGLGVLGSLGYGLRRQSKIVDRS